MWPKHVVLPFLMSTTVSNRTYAQTPAGAPRAEHGALDARARGHARYARATCEGKGAYLQEQEEPSLPSSKACNYSCNAKVSVVEHHPPILQLS